MASVKRSKWDDQEDSELVVSPQPPPKRRQKAVHHADVPTFMNKSPKRLVPSVFVPPRTHHPPLASSRSVYSYEKLNSIEEGSYGVVFRARDKQTGDIVALKKLKLDEEKYGFPITALREINALMVCRHENVVGIREVVVGETLTQYALQDWHASRVDVSRFYAECLS
jgi:cell division cycle 2-like protein